MNFVLDASVALAWCFEDESDEYSDAASSSDPATIACLAVIALALGFVAFRFFAHEQEDEWEPRELIHTRDRRDGS